MTRYKEMTYEKKTKRWRRRYRGIVYVVSCRELRMPPSPIESRVAANEWWRNKQNELDGLADTAAGQVNKFRIFMENLTRTKITSKEQLDQIFATWGSVPFSHVALRCADMADDQILVNGKSPRSDPDSTVKHWAEKWQRGRDDKRAAGNLSRGRAANSKISITHFADFIGADTAVNKINEGTVSGFYSHCIRNPKWDGGSQKNIFGYFQNFVNYCWEHRQIDLPRNLKSRDWKFDITDKEIVVWTAAECSQIIAAAQGQTRLHTLLMTNCGFTGVDIGTLHPDEINWTTGIIRRRRTKTIKEKNVPVVAWKLWDETIALLNEYRQPGERVLLKDDGSVWSDDGRSDMRHISRLLDTMGMDG